MPTTSVNINGIHELDFVFSGGNSVAATTANGVTTLTFTIVGGGGGGTVTSFSAGNLSPLFTTSVATATTTPALSFTLSSVGSGNQVFASPNGAPGTPSFRALVAADYPTMVGDSGTGGTKGAVPAPAAGDAAALKFLKADGTWATTPAGITLKTNGVNNGSQSILNLAAGTNVTLTDNGTGTVTIASSGGGGSPARTTASHTTASIANNTYEEFTITMAKSFLIQKLVVSGNCRVQFYSTNAAMVADRTRPIGFLPLATTQHGVIGDWALLGASYLTFICSPAVEGSNMESVVSTSISCRITNLTGSTGTVTMTVTYLPEET